MNYSDGGYSLADIAAATGNNSRNNDGFGGDGSWAWVLIFLIFAFGGWGRNGFGGGSGTGSVSDNYVLASDFATLQRQMDSGFDRIGNRIENVNNGICDGFYAMNTGMLNGFSGVQQAMCQGFSGINQAIATNGYETRLGTQNLASQLASCCCDIKEGIQGVNFNMAQNTCALQNTMNMNTRDIIESNNANYRALHDEIVANRIEDKNAQIQAQQNEINALRLAASQERQNNYLIDQLKPCPSPSYIVPNPNCCYNYGINGYGYNNNCGCNCGNY